MNISDIKVGDKFMLKITDLSSDGGLATVKLQSGSFFITLTPDVVLKMCKCLEQDSDEPSCSICELYIKGETCEQRDTCPVAALQSKYWALLRQNKQLRSEIQQIQDMLTADFKKRSKAIKDRLSYFKDIV